MNNVTENIISRRSCKSYKPDMVSDEIIDQIVEAGLYAASGMGKQAPIIIVVTDKEMRDKLSALNAEYLPAKVNDPFYGAPVVLCVICPKEISTAVYDGSLVMGNMMLAANSLGIGNCWIHRAKEMFSSDEGKAILARLGLDGEYEGIGNLVIGYAENMNRKQVPRKNNRVYRI
ncbi:MAG: nitroreductase [Faecalibacterium sp.]|nr:nitroreductase [Ruminococcus sp.]MCM1393235.1 nitroreductase [Ruminococcus sp.]MCM1486696.1 nitroreductase [Faecalibacterium sp.]